MTDSSHYVSTINDAGKRLDVFLADRSMYPSRSAAARAIQNHEVLVNGAFVQKKYEIVEGDQIIFSTTEQETPSLNPSSIDLDIRYEDDHIIVLSKQEGLVCHPSAEHIDDTLVNALINHCGIDNLCNVQGSDDCRRGIVHRLDRDTSGLMVVAKTNLAGEVLIDQIRNREVERHYFALVHGIVSVDSGMIDAPLARHPVDRKRMAVRDARVAREAITTFKVLERFSSSKDDRGFSLLDCKLFTGRTHQIRVHMEYIKHPVVGDHVYCAHGPRSFDSQCGATRQFLHSYRLEFNHPISGEFMTFCEQCPKALQASLDSISIRSLGRTDFGDEVAKLVESMPQPQLPAFVKKERSANC